MTDDDRIVAAGEYVLGTLDPDERAAFAAEIARDRRAAEAVRRWERALAPLADRIAPVAPPETAWAAIAARIVPAPAAPVARAVAANDNAAGAWRAAALAASLVAAALGGWLAVRPAATPAPVVIASAPAPTFVATLGGGAPKPGLLISFDEARGVLVAQPVGLSAPAGRSLQLWWIVGTAPPRPIGLIDATRAVRLNLGERVAPLGGTTFAVSIEPAGGSPTGQPTGPIPYTGTALRLPPLT